MAGELRKVPRKIKRVAIVGSSTATSRFLLRLLNQDKRLKKAGYAFTAYGKKSTGTANRLRLFKRIANARMAGKNNFSAVVFLGMVPNDASKGLRLGPTKKDAEGIGRRMLRMASIAKNAGFKKIIFVTPKPCGRWFGKRKRPVSETKKVRRWMLKTLPRKGATVVDIYSKLAAGKNADHMPRALSGDGLHLTHAGHRILAGMISERLVKRVPVAEKKPAKKKLAMR